MRGDAIVVEILAGYGATRGKGERSDRQRVISLAESYVRKKVTDHIKNKSVSNRVDS